MYLFKVLFNREGENNINTLYKGQAFSPSTFLTQQFSIGDDIMYVADGEVLPTAPNLLTLGEYGDVIAETILYTGKTDNVITGITRAVEGTEATFVEGTRVTRSFTAKDLNDLQTNVANTVEKEAGKGLSSNDFENKYLEMLSVNDKLPADFILQNELRKFVTDDEKTLWNSKAPGGFGWGEHSGYTIPGNDIHLLNKNQRAMWNPDTLNIPIPNTYGIVDAEISENGTFRFIIARPIGNSEGRVFLKIKWASTWRDWQDISPTNKFVGTEATWLALTDTQRNAYDEAWTY